MRGTSIFIIIVGILSSKSLLGQCPDRDFLWNRIIYLRDSTSVSLQEQRKELLPYMDKFKQCANSNDSVHCLLLQRIGALFFLDYDFVKGIEYTRQSIKIIYDHINEPAVNPKHLIKSYNNLRICYDSLGMHNLKTAAMDSCISLMVRLNSGYDYAVPLLYIRTKDFYEAGDYYRCIEYANLGERISKESGYELQHLYYYLIWKINALVYLKRLDESEELLVKTIRECEQSGEKYYLGSFYGLLARVFQEKGEVDKSLKASNIGFQYDKKIANYNGCAAFLNNTGNNLYFRKLKQYDKALEYNYQALQYADAMESLNVLDNIGNIYAARGLYDSALIFYQKAFDKLKPGINETTLLSSSVKDFTDRNISEYLVELILDKADTYVRKYKTGKKNSDVEEAKRICKVADRFLEKIKSLQTESLSKIFWRSNSHRLYETALEACFFSGDINNAFYFFERSRAVLLSDQLNEQKILRTEEIRKQYSLLRSVNKIERELNDLDQASSAYTDRYKILLQQKMDLDRLKEQIKVSNPIYYQTYLDTNFINLVEVQNIILQKHSTMLELFTGDSAIYLLCLGQEESKLIKIDPDGFRKLTAQYNYYLSDRELLLRDFAGFKKVSADLYSIIFSDVKIRSGRIIISPDGIYFPFESLIVTSGEGDHYLLEDYAISYTFSARFLLNDFGLSSDNTKSDFMGMAPVKFPLNFNLATLAGSDRSLNRLKSYFRYAENFVESEAKGQKFLDNFHRYRIIQLYTHATDSGYNSEPVIYFADSTLQLSDLIYENRANTSLVVLSACKTASGKLQRGEGVFSFSRGFAALGIPSTITNLWSVENESTYKLTELFYKHLSNGLSLDVALQQAKLEFLHSSTKEKQLPHYWAAAILAGLSNPIEVKKPIPWKYIALGSIALIGIFGWWIWRRKSKTAIPIPGTKEIAA